MRCGYLLFLVEIRNQTGSGINPHHCSYGKISLIRGAGSVIMLVEPTRSWDVIFDSSSGVQGHVPPLVRGWGQSHPEAEALTNLHFFVAMLKTVCLCRKSSFLKIIVCDLDFWIHDLVSVISSSPDCMKYLCQFWLKSLQRFRIYRVHKIFMAVAAWLDLWPVTLKMSRGPGSKQLWWVSLKYVHSRL